MSHIKITISKTATAGRGFMAEQHRAQVPGLNVSIYHHALSLTLGPSPDQPTMLRMVPVGARRGESEIISAV